MKYKIPLILGTARKDNQSQKVARYLLNRLEKFPEVFTQLLDLGKTGFPLMEYRLESWQNAPELLVQWYKLLKEAHGVIIVAPEYKNAYPGTLKNFLDYMPPGIFRYKPIGISTVSSGAYGGSNCLAQLRLVCISMAGLPIPDRFQVANVAEAMDESGHFKRKKNEEIAEKFLREMLKYTKTLSVL